MTEKFSLEPVEDWATWDSYVNASPQGSLFLLSHYLKSAGVLSRAWFVRKGSSIRGGLCVQETGQDNECRLDDLVIYNGLWFLPDGERKPTRARSERFEITEAAIGFLTTHYTKVELALSPQFEELRPFLWHRYHGPEEEKINLSLRYTSYLDIQDLCGLSQGSEDCETFRRLEAVRQRNLRKAAKAGSICYSEGDIETLLDNYAQTIGLSADEFCDKRARMDSLMKGLRDRDMGRLYEVADRAGDPDYGVFFAWDSKRAYYLFGAGNPDRNDSHHGTFAFWEALRDLATNHEITEVDWEGANSPQRGWFKLSFGGSLLPYHELRWEA